MPSSAQTIGGGGSWSNYPWTNPGPRQIGSSGLLSQPPVLLPSYANTDYNRINGSDPRMRFRLDFEPVSPPTTSPSGQVCGMGFQGSMTGYTGGPNPFSSTLCALSNAQNQRTLSHWDQPSDFYSPTSQSTMNSLNGMLPPQSSMLVGNSEPVPGGDYYPSSMISLNQNPLSKDRNNFFENQSATSSANMHHQSFSHVKTNNMDLMSYPECLNGYVDGPLGNGIEEESSDSPDDDRLLLLLLQLGTHHLADLPDLRLHDNELDMYTFCM